MRVKTKLDKKSTKESQTYTKWIKENKNKVNTASRPLVIHLFSIILSIWYLQPSLGGKALTIKVQK